MALGLAAYSVTTYTSSIAAAATVVSPTFSPAAGDVIFCVGFIDGPVTGAITENTPTNSGTALTWHLVKRENTFNANVIDGSLFVYWAFNAAGQSNITVTVNSPNSTALLKGVAVLGFTGADSAQTGAVSVATHYNSATTTPTSGSLTTSTAGSWIWMAGWNWTNFRSGLAAASGQSFQIAPMDAQSNGDTEFLQKENPQPSAGRASGTVVTMSDTGGTASDEYHLVAWEIVPAAGGVTPSQVLTRAPQVPPVTLRQIPPQVITGPVAATPGTGNAQLATGAGAALSPTVEIDTSSTGLASGTGTAQAPVAATGANAGLATGTGAALQPSAAAANAGGVPVTQALFAVSAVPVQIAPRVITAAQVPPGTGNAGLATGTGTAQQPSASVGANAGLATGTGTAQAPVAATGANAGLATGTGVAQQPVPAVTVLAGLATGTGAALQPTVQTSGSTNAPAQLATGTGTAQAPAVTLAVLAGLPTGTGAAQAPSIAAMANASAARALAAALDVPLAVKNATSTPAVTATDTSRAAVTLAATSAPSVSDG